jgi:hypothetical protein
MMSLNTIFFYILLSLNKLYFLASYNPGSDPRYPSPRFDSNSSRLYNRQLIQFYETTIEAGLAMTPKFLRKNALLLDH